MIIEQLHWDSSFFGYSIGKVQTNNTKELNVDLLAKNSFKLIYIFSPVELEGTATKELNLKLVDVKTELIREVEEYNESYNTASEIKKLHELSDGLLDLTYQSGHYSRFKLDEGFVDNEFQKLYKEWILKSLDEKSGHQVFGFLIQGQLAGFITFGSKNDKLEIGLLAVHHNYRNKHIGKKLLDFTVHFAKNNSYKEVMVATQVENTGALKFYLNNCFIVQKTTYIYHLWK